MQSRWLILTGLIVGLSLWIYTSGKTSATAPRLLTVGQPAPAFSGLTTPDGQPVSSESLKGQGVILVFYPMDNTPGCTIQLCALRDQWPRLQSLNTTVFGVNPGSLESHRGFAEKQKLPFPLLVDKNGEIAKAFGIKTTMTVQNRTVVILDPQGIVRYIKEGLPPVTELLSIVEAFQPAALTAPVAAQ